MRIHIRGAAAILFLGLSLSGCAANMGAVAGNVVGGTAWGMMKGGKLAWKGGTFAAKVTGKTVVGAAKGVHEEFSPKASGGDGNEAALGERARDVGPVASAQRQGAALAD